MSCGQHHLTVEGALEIIMRQIPHPMSWPWADVEKERMRQTLVKCAPTKGITQEWLEEWIPRARKRWYQRFDEELAGAMLL